MTMTTADAEPESLEELQEMVRSAYAPVRPLGAGTKASEVSDGDFARVSLRRLSGITEYQPSEYTITARAGTPLREINDALAARGQRLPFDPPLAGAGATIGGTVAAGLSGPGRHRFGGVRDFLIGVRFVSGSGDLISGGGKVVKNAAGFDFPKLMVGSCGRFGALAEVCFKVFPAPKSRRSIELRSQSHAEAASAIVRLSSGRWEADAIDYDAEGGVVSARFGGPTDEATAAVANDAAESCGLPSRMLGPEEAAAFWDDVSELRFAGMAPILIRAGVSPGPYAATQDGLDAIGGMRCRLSGGGAQLFVAAPSEAPKLDQIDEVLARAGIAAVVARGREFGRRLGRRWSAAADAAVKSALDPDGRFWNGAWCSTASSARTADRSPSRSSAP